MNWLTVGSASTSGPVSAGGDLTQDHFLHNQGYKADCASGGGSDREAQEEQGQDKITRLDASAGPVGLQVVQDKGDNSYSDVYNRTWTSSGSASGSSGSTERQEDHQSTTAIVDDPVAGVSVDQYSDTSSSSSSQSSYGPGYSDGSSSSSNSSRKGTLAHTSLAGFDVQAGQQSYAYTYTYSDPGGSTSSGSSGKQTGAWITGPVSVGFVGQSSVDGDCTMELGPLGAAPGPLAPCPLVIPGHSGRARDPRLPRLVTPGAGTGRVLLPTRPRDGSPERLGGGPRTTHAQPPPRQHS